MRRPGDPPRRRGPAISCCDDTRSVPGYAQRSRLQIDGSTRAEKGEPVIEIQEESRVNDYPEVVTLRLGLNRSVNGLGFGRSRQEAYANALRSLAAEVQITQRLIEKKLKEIEKDSYASFY